MGSHFFFPRYFSIAIVLVGAQVLNARFISIAFGGRLDLVGAPIFISIAVSGRMALVGAPLFISIAFGDRIALDGAPRFISISFGGRMVLVGALRNYMGIPLKIHKIVLNFRICGACRRAGRRIVDPAIMKTARYLDLHTQTDRGTCPGAGL
jgi:hypothetical protein